MPEALFRQKCLPAQQPVTLVNQIVHAFFILRTIFVRTTRLKFFQKLRSQQAKNN